MNNNKNPFIEKNPSYRENEWARALNKQGYLSCCQLISGMKGYINTNLDELSKAEKNWFCRFSWWFLTEVKEKVSFCEECLEFYERLGKSVKVVK